MNTVLKGIGKAFVSVLTSTLIIADGMLLHDLMIGVVNRAAEKKAKKEATKAATKAA